MRKRFASLLLALLVLATLLPVQAFAYLGGAVEQPLQSFVQDAAVKRESMSGDSQIYSLKMNDGKLVMFLATSGTHMGKSVTNSDRGYVNFAEAVGNGVYEQARFTLQTGKSGQKTLTIAKMEVIDDPDVLEDAGVWVIPNSLTVRYTFRGYGSLDPHVICYISYYFIELGPGSTDGKVSDTANDPDGHTYALVAQGKWGTDENDDNVSEYVFRWYQDYHGFSRLGHAQAEPAAHVKMARTYESLDGAVSAKNTDITSGLGRTYTYGKWGKGNISEIYSDSYGVDSPFVLLESERVGNTNDAFTPLYVTYDASTDRLTAEGHTRKLGGYSGTTTDASAFHVWGLRDVYTKEEAASLSDVRFTEPDAVTIPQDADKLGIYKTSSGMVAEPITDAARQTVLKNKYGDPLYILRGSYRTSRSESGKYYEFTDGKLALTSTITATWNTATQHFYVRVGDGNVITGFDTTSRVEYTTPRFKLYSPGSTVTAPATLSFDEDDCLALSMDPEENEVLVFIDIPEVSSLIDNAQIKGNGDLILTGTMGLDLILNCSPDKLVTLEALGYSPEADENNNIRFVQKGIKAHGSLDTGSLVGLDLAEIEAAINTFEGEEQYDFSLEVDAFGLFETAADLSLKRLYNGRLVPDRLYFELAVEPGIPLVPPIPTAFLRGAGGGFSGLADTINGDYIAIPPMRLKFTAIGDYVKVIKGKLHITAGPSYLEYAGSDLEIVELDVIDSFNMYLRLEGERRSYLGKTYTGLRAGGGMGITMKVPEGDKAIFEVEGRAEASLFGGLDNYSKPTSAHIQIDCRGGITGKVMIPKKIGKTELKGLGGKTLAQASVDFILGAQTAVTVNPADYAGKDLAGILKTASTSAWDNLSVYGGLSHTGDLGIIHYRIYYVLPNHPGGDVSFIVKLDEDWSLEDEIEKNAWYINGADTQQANSDLQVMAVPMGGVYDETTGEQVGIAVMEVAAPNASQDALLAAAAASGYTADVTYDSASGKTGDMGLMLLAKDSTVTARQLLEGLTVTSADGTAMTLVSFGSDPDNIPANANVLEITRDGRDGLLIDMDATGSADHRWTVNASHDFDAYVTASAPVTTLDLTLTDRTANTAVRDPLTRDYAVRYYLDTAADRTGEHYYLGMTELKNTTTDSFSVPAAGSLAPTGSYYVTAVLVEKITGDFDGSGAVEEDEWSWVTVDTRTSAAPINYTNDLAPAAPVSVTLDATGNETLTAGWKPSDNADGYRVTLTYLENGVWKQAGASYMLDNADFNSDSKTPAASRAADGTLSLRMAPTVGGKSFVDGMDGKDSTTTAEADAAPADRNYRVTVEAFRNEPDAAGAENLRYYSTAATSAEKHLPVYTAPEITVTTGDGRTVTLNGTSGYDTLTWNALPTGTLFTVTGSTVTGLTVTAEQGTGAFTVTRTGDGWTVTPEVTGRALIENSGRVKLTVKSGSGDSTDYYLRLTLDDVAPLLTLDSTNVPADEKTGAYTVSGLTEAGLTVTMTVPAYTDENGDDVPEQTLTAAADATGRFTFTGNLTGDAAAGFSAILSDVSARDEAGNDSDAVSVLISARPKTGADQPVDPGPTPSRPSGGSSGGGSPYITALKTSDKAPSATDYTSGIYGLTFRSTASFSSFRGVQVDGKLLDPSHYIAEEGSIVVYLKAVYLRTLKPGTHTVTILSTEGNTSMNFTIGGKTSASTGDPGVALYAAAALLSLTGSAVLTTRRKRR